MKYIFVLIGFLIVFCSFNCIAENEKEIDVKIITSANSSPLHLAIENTSIAYTNMKIYLYCFVDYEVNFTIYIDGEIICSGKFVNYYMVEHLSDKSIISEMRIVINGNHIVYNQLRLMTNNIYDANSGLARDMEGLEMMQYELENERVKVATGIGIPVFFFPWLTARIIKTYKDHKITYR